MSSKKSDLVKAIEKFDEKIAGLQAEIANLESSKALLQSVLQEKEQKVVAKKAVSTRKPRAKKVTPAADVNLLAPSDLIS